MKGSAEDVAKDSEGRALDLRTPEGREIYRHSTSHIMATAIQALYPETKFTLGPPPKEGEKFGGVSRIHGVELHGVHRVMHEQRRKLLPAGHDERAARVGGHEREHVIGRARVVEHEQQLALLKHGTEKGGLTVHIGGKSVGGYAEGAQRMGERLGRGERRIGIVPAKVEEQLAVREPLTRLMGPLHGERRLARPGRA